eukprot:m.109230 g.109230  ORF g.109230 m.109230 type:complete len:59 (-) comp27935_c0_seq1:65-241(-)
MQQQQQQQRAGDSGYGSTQSVTCFYFYSAFMLAFKHYVTRQHADKQCSFQIRLSLAWR